MKHVPSPESHEARLATYPSLKGKRVVVTGGGSGIGASLVEAFVGQGADVIFVDILEKESAELVARLAESLLEPGKPAAGRLIRFVRRLAGNFRRRGTRLGFEETKHG